MAFNTANGQALAEDCVDITIKELGVSASPFIMQDTPPVFLVGKHCVENGFTFVFKPDYTAYFIDSSGKVVPLTVEGGSHTSRLDHSAACPLDLGVMIGTALVLSCRDARRRLHPRVTSPMGR